jgi:hypothetical protein
MNDKRKDRIANANAVIRAIGSHGRRFFYSSKYDRYGSFSIDDIGCLRYRDDYSGKAIKVVQGGKWRGFSHGGTCRAIVESLAHYIRTGDPINAGHFGPWPDWVCFGDLWGYGKDAMEEVRSAALSNPAVRTPKLEDAA